MISNIGYEKSKKWARKTYSKINFVVCPKLNGEGVVFNNIGFNHLIRKAVRRSRREQKFRFSLIQYAPMIISDTNVLVTYRKIVLSNGKVVQFWSLQKMIKDRVLRVIVRQVGNGRKHFYSIMQHVSKNPA